MIDAADEFDNDVDLVVFDQVFPAIREAITGIDVLDSTDELFASQAERLSDWNKILG
ncbi:MAG: hypothetical protein L7V86_02840 [Verrucomicrobiales bacterium]|nr:hypothetical protein [Verrucomicrobiales bacterium]